MSARLLGQRRAHALSKITPRRGFTCKKRANKNLTQETNPRFPSPPPPSRSRPRPTNQSPTAHLPPTCLPFSHPGTASPPPSFPSRFYRCLHLQAASNSSVHRAGPVAEEEEDAGRREEAAWIRSRECRRTRLYHRGFLIASRGSICNGAVGCFFCRCVQMLGQVLRRLRPAAAAAEVARGYSAAAKEVRRRLTETYLFV